jgi:hypothetical protein
VSAVNCRSTREIAGDIITMNSRAELVDLETEEKVALAVVFPRDADLSAIAQATVARRVGYLLLAEGPSPLLY